MGTPCEFSHTVWTAGRDARPMARPIRLRTFYVLLGSRRLGLDGLVARVDGPCRKPTAPSAPTPRTARPAGLAWDSAYCLGATTLHTTWVSGSCTFLCSSHTGHRTHCTLHNARHCSSSQSPSTISAGCGSRSLRVHVLLKPAYRQIQARIHALVKGRLELLMDEQHVVQCSTPVGFPEARSSAQRLGHLNVALTRKEPADLGGLILLSRHKRRLLDHPQVYPHIPIHGAKHVKLASLHIQNKQVDLPQPSLLDHLADGPAGHRDLRP